MQQQQQQQVVQQPEAMITPRERRSGGWATKWTNAGG
jgi:hypothetical protein